MYKDRIRNESLYKKVMSAHEASTLIKNGMTVGCSGFTPSGYPKAIPQALAERVEKDKLNIKIDLITGASVGDELDGALSRADIIHRRLPYQTNGSLRERINIGKCMYTDMHLSHSSQYIKNGFLGDIDIAIVEAVAITEDGDIIPTTSVGNSPVLVDAAKQVIVEINNNYPASLEDFFDIYKIEKAPYTKPIPITSVDDRVGISRIKCGKEKIAAIVISDIKDKGIEFSQVDETANRISAHLIEFLNFECKSERLPKNLFPIQSGVGSIANAVLNGFCEAGFSDLTFYTEVIQDSMIELICKGIAKVASGTSLTLSKDKMDYFLHNIDYFKDKIILRPQEISNHPEIVRRLGLISINTAIEADIFGNVNSTHIMGSSMMNGIGGSGDFTRNAYISIFTTPSTAKGGEISTIVPMVSHHDHTEHDVMVIVTEQGVADLRGLSPFERALEIINNFAHPSFRAMLLDYCIRATKNTSARHTPHIIDEALSWHDRFLKTGTMHCIE